MNCFSSCKTLAIFMLFGNLTYGYSQQSVIWTAIQTPVQLSSKWQLPVDVSYRTIGFSSSAFQYTFRAGARRIFNERWNVAAGAALFMTRTSFQKEDHEFGKELRLWQEVVAEHPLTKRLTIQNRFRAEERKFGETSATDDFSALRFRYRLALIGTVNDKWKVQLADEYMQQLASGDFHFQQNRLGGSCIYIFSQTAQLQAGYIWSALKSTSQHIIILAFQKLIVLNGSSGHKK